MGLLRRGFLHWEEKEMNKKMVEYQMFTKCNLKCPYCYNYFDQNVDSLNNHIADLKKISLLADEETLLVINGGEPFLFKDLAKLINSVQIKTNIQTYTNGLLPKRVYEKFINEVNKDNLHFTISIHYAELLRTGNVNEKFKNNLKYIIQNLPKVKVNIVFTEDFLNKQFTEDLTELLKELNEYGLKYINVLLQDELKFDPVRAIKLVSTEHFKKFFKELQMFEYRHCMWNNTDSNVSCLQMWLRKEIMNPDKGYKTISFLKYNNDFILENNFGIVSKYIDEYNKVIDIDELIKEVKPLL